MRIQSRGPCQSPWWVVPPLWLAAILVLSASAAGASTDIQRPGRVWNGFDESVDGMYWPGGADQSSWPESFPSSAGLNLDSGSFGSRFRRAWVPITAGEFALLGITAAMPREWTGWSADFVSDGVNHFKEAWSNPPVMDDDAWFHNYVGHPYGGAVYYNSMRCQGGSVGESFLMATILSTQWEYLIESVAERPSIQDLIITPIAGALLGEAIHQATVGMRRNGTTLPEKVAITILNPASAILNGY